MENANNGQQRDHAELDLRVDENDAIFCDNNNNENPRRAPRDRSIERDGDHDRASSIHGRDSCKEGDDRRGTLDCSREREGNAQKRPRSSRRGRMRRTRGK